MALSSASTDAQVEAAYDDNATYAETQSVALCRAFISSCRILIRRVASGMGKGSNSLNYDRAMLQKELDRAQDWLLAHTTTDADRPGPNVTRADFRSLR